MSDFPSFDQLVKMAKEQPDALEQLRQQEVERIIHEAPPECRQRLRGLQFQIDAQRQLHKGSPMGACMKISQMMHESFAELRGWLNEVTGTNDPLRNEMDALQTEEKIAAKVLPFAPVN